MFHNFCKNLKHKLICTMNNNCWDDRCQFLIPKLRKELYVEVNYGLKCFQFYDNIEKIYKYIGKCIKK